MSEEDVGSIWFRRLVKELKNKSKHFRIVPIRHGFYRVYWKDAYVHELYKEMPHKGYSIETDSIYKDSLKLMQEYEEDGEIQRKVKNFVEGYYDASKAIMLRMYQFKNNDEHYQVAKDMYRNVVVK